MRVSACNPLPAGCAFALGNLTYLTSPSLAASTTSLRHRNLHWNLPRRALWDLKQSSGMELCHRPYLMRGSSAQRTTHVRSSRCRRQQSSELEWRRRQTGLSRRRTLPRGVLMVASCAQSIHATPGRSPLAVGLQ
jgi:hypothetical protein